MFHRGSALLVAIATAFAVPYVLTNGVDSVTSSLPAQIGTPRPSAVPSLLKDGTQLTAYSVASDNRAAVAVAGDSGQAAIDANTSTRSGPTASYSWQPISDSLPPAYYPPTSQPAPAAAPYQHPVPAEQALPDSDGWVTVRRWTDAEATTNQPTSGLPMQIPRAHGVAPAGNVIPAQGNLAPASGPLNSGGLGNDPRFTEPPLDFETLFQFEMRPDDIIQRFSRVSSFTIPSGWLGMRVPLVSGTNEDDLAGSLSYYFDRQGQLQRFDFDGSTGDPRRIIELVRRRFGLQTDAKLGSGLLVAKNRQQPPAIVSALRLRQTPIVRQDQPRRRYLIKLEVNRPDGDRQLSPEFANLLASESLPFESSRGKNADDQAHAARQASEIGGGTAEVHKPMSMVRGQPTALMIPSFPIDAAGASRASSPPVSQSATIHRPPPTPPSYGYPAAIGNDLRRSPGNPIRPSPRPG